MSLPAVGAPASDAASLFVERARQARPGFTCTDDEPIRQICAASDGLPLAIELAAARLRMMSLEQLAAGVTDRLRLLMGGPRTVSARHRTLRASIDWSHELLAPDERVLLRRVAVFTGGFTLDAAESICAADAIEPERVLDLLGALVDQSLVIADEHGRYRLLETVRQYGLERLAQAEETDALRDRHRDVFLAFAEEASSHLETGEHRAWLDRLDPESANLAAAIEHALGSDPVLALRLCVALHRWWGARGRLAEAELAHSRSLEACATREPALRAQALVGRAFLATGMGAYEATLTHATEALALADEAGDDRTAARARCHIGHVVQLASPRASRADLVRAVELARSAGDDWAFVTAKQWLASAYFLEFDHAAATRANDEAVELAERLGDPFLLGRRWLWATWMLMHDGRLVEARAAIERAFVAYAGIAGAAQEALAVCGISQIDTWEGEAERALARLERHLELALKLGARLGVPWLLEVTAFAQLAAGQLDAARDGLERLLALLGEKPSFVAARALGLLAEVQRLQGDDAAEATARRAQHCGERYGNRFLATHLVLARVAAAQGEWTVAQQAALAHLDVCAQGGHETHIPACLDALGEVAAGFGEDRDAVRLLAAAERSRERLGIVRIPAEPEHWAAIDRRLREALGQDGYEAARAQGGELTTDDALEWAARSQPRRRPRVAGRH